ncbi:MULTISPECIES: hypothetical protein [unclassified Pseudomonas]|uniref:hypothetical protein n=1 Tax=unclassified Pseudomonas TaxID=196821 RepID=UPI00128D5ADE|nr:MULTISPECIES: hypothetical protein [unclassified Pseudomonas]MPQ69657.1 hypothetical protein [Pseudomonas sp. MWU12-2323]
MSKIKITVATIGHMPAEFQKKKLKEWKSSIFEVVDEIENYSLNCQSDGLGWEFTDAPLENVLPTNFNGDFLVSIVNVPIEGNWYTRRLTSNRVVFSFHEIKDILRSSNIPLENIIYRLFYAYSLLYKRSENRIPTNTEHTSFTHDETRGCIFDMNGIKTDIIHSCHKPILCSSCVERTRQEKVSSETIEKCQSEIYGIQKDLFYKMTDFIKQHPVWSLAISGLTAIVLGAIGSVVGSYVYEAIKH